MVHAPRNLQFHMSSSSQQTSSGTTEWETLIKTFLQHQINHWRKDTYLHPACETCYRILPADQSASFDNFWSWYSNNFNATNYSGETLRRFNAVIKFLKKVDPNNRSPAQDQQLSYLSSELIQSCAYSFSPNYTTLDTILIILQLGFNTNYYTEGSKIDREYRGIKKEIRKRQQNLFEKPKSPSPPLSDIELRDEPAEVPKSSSTSIFSLDNLLSLGKGKQKETPTPQGTVLRSGKTLYRQYLTKPTTDTQQIQLQ